MEQKASPHTPYPSNYMTYPMNSGNLRGFKSTFSKGSSFSSSCTSSPSSFQMPYKPCYWELLSPAIFGAVGALILSILTEDTDGYRLQSEGNYIFQLALIGYGLGATAAAVLAIVDSITNFKPSFHNLVFPIVGVIVSVLLLFASEYLLLYRVIPGSFKGYVGDNLLIQYLSFLYFSTTTIATGNLGDILPTSTTPRLLISTEIGFTFFVIGVGIQLLLAEKN